MCFYMYENNVNTQQSVSIVPSKPLGIHIESINNLPIFFSFFYKEIVIIDFTAMLLTIVNSILIIGNWHEYMI